jgi:hypothetical protein
MLFFDFLYYKIAKTYESYNEKGAESSSAAVVGACQAFNVLTVLTLIFGLDINFKLIERTKTRERCCWSDHSCHIPDYNLPKIFIQR